MSRDPNRPEGLGRRDFARLVAGGAAALFVRPGLAWTRPAPLPPTPDAPNEGFWRSVRDQFVMPKELAVMNAANLCPSPGRVLEAMYSNTRDMDHDPSPANRRKFGEGKEATRKLLADYLRVSPEEIVITRNTSESNNHVSSGLQLGPGDEVIIFSDNHPSNHAAWREKAKRYGYTVKIVDQVNPHPGPQYYVDTFTAQMTPRTKVLAFSHVTNTVGDIMPAKELCRVAAERGVLTLVDGAQSFGVMDVDLADMQPDFYTGSAHKWPCGPKECGVLYINRRAHSKIWANIISAYPGAVGISKSFESFGQRDEPCIIAFGEAIKFQSEIGKTAVETRARDLSQALIAGLRKIDGVKVWTHGDPALGGPVVSFQPGSLNAGKLAAVLYEKERIACATRGGGERGGLRFSPHLYNLHEEVDRTLAAIAKYMRTGV